MTVIKYTVIKYCWVNFKARKIWFKWKFGLLLRFQLLSDAIVHDVTMFDALLRVTLKFNFSLLRRHQNWKIQKEQNSTLRQETFVKRAPKSLDLIKFVLFNVDSKIKLRRIPFPRLHTPLRLPLPCPLRRIYFIIQNSGSKPMRNSEPLHAIQITIKAITSFCGFFYKFARRAGRMDNNIYNIRQITPFYLWLLILNLSFFDHYAHNKLQQFINLFH